MESMKQKRFVLFLMIEAAVLGIFCLLRIELSGFFTTIVAFPFEQAGIGLRALSLSGKAGNAAAIFLYLLFSLSPCAYYILLVKKGKENKIDSLLIILSILLFIVNYYMINPGLFRVNVPGGGKMLLGSVFYSAFFGYVVLRVLRMYASADEVRLQKGLLLLLCFMNLVFVYVICWQELGKLLSSIMEIKSANSLFDMEAEYLSMASQLMPTYLFLVIRFLVDALPYVFDIVIVFLAMRVLEELACDRYSDQAVAAVKKLAGFCVRALAVTVASGMLFNILQLLFGGLLYQVDVTIAIPVSSVIFVLVVLLMARYIQEDQKLKQDNDLFI